MEMSVSLYIDFYWKHGLSDKFFRKQRMWKIREKLIGIHFSQICFVSILFLVLDFIEFQEIYGFSMIELKLSRVTASNEHKWTSNI